MVLLLEILEPARLLQQIILFLILMMEMAKRILLKIRLFGIMQKTSVFMLLCISSVAKKEKEQNSLDAI